MRFDFLGGKLNKREASYLGKINVRIMDFISELEKSDFLQGKTSYVGTSYPDSTVVPRCLENLHTLILSNTSHL
jgi:hypothetical protein